MNHFDVAVVGLGGMGCANIYHLDQAGLRVLGIDQFGPVSSRRASTSYRGIRHAYFDDDRHVALSLSSTRGFADLQSKVGKQLLWQPSGVLLHRVNYWFESLLEQLPPLVTEFLESEVLRTCKECSWVFPKERGAMQE